MAFCNPSRPREAAITIVNYINHRNPNVSLLALNVGSRPMRWIGAEEVLSMDPIDRSSYWTYA